MLNLWLCSECRHYVRSYKNTIRLSVDGLRAANPVEKVPVKLLQIIINIGYYNQIKMKKGTLAKS